MEYAVHVELSIIDGQRYDTNPSKLTTVCVMKVLRHGLAILDTIRGRACRKLLRNRNRAEQGWIFFANMCIET